MKISKIEERKLIKEALLGMRNAFTGTNKSTDIRYGSAVLTKKGNIYSSGQYYSDTFSLTLHAEQAALSHAAAHGDYEIMAISIVSNERGDKETYPCHMCKQLLWENYLRSRLNIKIFILDTKGKIIKKLNLLDIINYPWPNSEI